MKMIVGLFTAALMGGGLVGLSSEAANAVCDSYTGCPDTSAKVSAPGSVKQGRRAEICVSVRTNGNGKPKGRVSVSVERNAGGYSFSDSQRYDGRTCFTTTQLNKLGNYTVSARFVGNDFRNSNDSATFKVVRKR
jgi:hypothetical protein